MGWKVILLVGLYPDTGIIKTYIFRETDPIDFIAKHRITQRIGY